METESRFQRWKNKTLEWLNEQQWFQQLRAKWDELDPQSRTYLSFASLGGVVLAFVAVLLSAYFSVRSVRNEVREKTELLSLIEKANEEFRTLRATTPAVGMGGQPSGNNDAGPWNVYLEATASNAGIDRGNLEVGKEKPLDSGQLAKEALIDVGLKHVSIRQVVKYIFSLESGPRPVKLRNLTIDTKSDPEGYMDATLALSAFQVK